MKKMQLALPEKLPGDSTCNGNQQIFFSFVIF
jgi:hypothetical protein